MTVDVSQLVEGWTSHIGVSPWHLRSDANEDRREFFGWDRLNHVLSYHSLEFPRVRIVHREEHKQDIDITVTSATRSGKIRSRVDTALMYEKLNQGGTLTVAGVSNLDPLLRSVCDSLGLLFGIRTGANVYASSKPERGLGLHWDDHDVLIIQIDGRKLWDVYEPTRPYPLRGDTEPNESRPSDPALSVTLEPGDLLYIPRGWWHDVVALDEPTLHLTISLHWKTGADYLSWLAKQMTDDDLIRQDLPIDGPSRVNASSAIRDALRERLESDSMSIAAFDRDSKASTRVRSTSSLPIGIDGVPLSGSAVITSNCAWQHSIDVLADIVTCRVNGWQMSVKGKCAGLLALVLQSTEPLEVRHICEKHADELDKEEIHYLLAFLIKAGLITASGVSPR